MPISKITFSTITFNENGSQNFFTFLKIILKRNYNFKLHANEKHKKKCFLYGNISKRINIKKEFANVKNYLGHGFYCSDAQALHLNIILLFLDEKKK